MMYRGRFENIPDPLERLKQKHILVLSGKDDELVPWKASKKFIAALEAVSDIVEPQTGDTATPLKKLQVHLYDGVGHEVTDEMKREFYNWIGRFVL